MRPHRLVARVRRTIEKYRMFSPGDRVVVAVSGGPDSVALLHILYELRGEYPLSLAVAHFNHKLRGGESDEDEQFVRERAGSLGLEFLSQSRDVRSYASERGLNLEEAGRLLRYRFLRRALKELSGRALATGHNRNDQAETVLMRLLKGAGLEGLAAIRPRMLLESGAKIVRPLIEAERSEIVDYLERRGLAYRLDPSNVLLDRTRNKIRRELLPELAAKYNPKIVMALARLADLAGEELSFVEERTRELAARLIEEREGMVSIQASELLRLHPALRRRLLREAIKRARGNLRRITFVNIEEALRLAETTSGKELSLPGGLVVRREFDKLLVEKRRGPVEYEYRLELPGAVDVKEAGCRIEAEVVGAGATAGENAVLLDGALIGRTLVVRNRRPGDRLELEGKSVKLKKLLIERKVPLSRRRALPVLATDNQVIWVPGLPPARNYRAPEGAERSLLLRAISLRREPEGGARS